MDMDVPATTTDQLSLRDKLLFSIDDAAFLLSFSTSFLYKAVSAKTLNHIKLGKGVVRFTRENLEDFVQYLAGIRDGKGKHKA